MRRHTRILALTLLLLLLCSCSNKPEITLSEVQATTADLFHGEDVYLFLPHDGPEETFLQTFGVTKEQISEATSARHRKLQEADPAYVFTFEGVPAMVIYQRNGFGLLVNFQEADAAALAAATEAVLNGMEQQFGVRPEVKKTGWSTELGEATIRLSFYDPDGGSAPFWNALTVTFPKKD